MSKADKLAKLAALADELGIDLGGDEGTSDSDTQPLAHISMGYLVAGTGPSPGEGDIVTVPTAKGGKRRRRIKGLVSTETVELLRGSVQVNTGDRDEPVYVDAQWFAIPGKVKQGEK